MTRTLTEKSSITQGRLVADYAAYNQWANEHLVNWLRNKPVELMDQIIPSSFPSLRETLVHIWDTQRFWLAVVSKTPPPVSFRMHGFHGTLEEVFEGIVKQSKEFTTFINSLDDNSLLEPILLETPWVNGTQARVEFIHHCLNHSTYHRGQLITIGRNVGITDAPMTDFSFYLLYIKGK